ncbi:MAG: metallophosphoesterase [Candidatus Adiutrix sp.]|jgi:predicted MPP superfamily phosphohydrolase|nr:metallophosphoesterase [Candidatus Adiutrix sp.]
MTTIILALLAASVWYVPGRLKKLLGLRTIWPWRIVALLPAAAFPAVLRTGAYISPNPVLAWLYNLSGLFFIFWACFFLYLLAAHLLTPLLKNVPGRKIAATGLILSLAYVGYGFFQAQSFTVTSHEIQVRGLARPVKIAHLPDLHLGAQRSEKYLNKVIETVNQYQPDLVFFNGDLVDSDIALRPELFALFRRLGGQAYFTTGNHEYYINTARALELVAGAGLRILRNEMVEVHGLQLIGLEYMRADRSTYDAHMVNDLTIEEELPRIRRDPGRPSILLHHSPVGLRYVAAGGLNLMLAGHTHGGQLFPGTLLARMRYPLTQGRHEIDGTVFLVSQGAGTFGPWMRVGTSNEIQFIRLTPPNS